MRENIHPLEQEEVMAYLDGELTDADATRAAEHLHGCRDCQELAADLQSVSRRMAEWQVAAGDQPMSQANVTALQQIEANSVQDLKQIASPWRRLFAPSALVRWAWAASGAALALIIVASMTLTEMSQPPPAERLYRVGRRPLRIS